MWVLKGDGCCFLLEYLLLMYVKICKQLSSFVGFLFVTLLKNYTYKVGWGGWGSRDSCEIRRRLYSCCLYMGDTSHVNTCTIRHSYATSQILWLPSPPVFFQRVCILWVPVCWATKNLLELDVAFILASYTSFSLPLNLTGPALLKMATRQCPVSFSGSLTLQQKLGGGSWVETRWCLKPAVLFLDWGSICYVWKWELAGRNWHWQLTFLG